MNGMRPKLKLLFVLPFPPRLDATNGGGRVMAQLIQRLATRHRIALLYFRGSDERGLDVSLRELCELTEEVHRPWTASSGWQRSVRNARLLLSLLLLRPMWVTDWSSRVYAKQLMAIAQSWEPEIVQFEYGIMGQYLGSLRDCVASRVLVEYEPGIRSAPYLRRTIPILNRPIRSLDRLAWTRFESSIVERVQTTVVFTYEDRAALQEMGAPLPIVRIPIGAGIPDAPLSPVGQPPPSLVFIGNFIHPPNREAALRLARLIFPPIRAEYPESRLFIVGNAPPPELLHMAHDGVLVTGEVDTVEPYLDRAAVVIAPLSSGGGMRVKVLEALASGKAVVTSRLGVEGLDVKDGEHVVLAESDQEFALRIQELLADEARRGALAARARAWACANLDWKKSIAAYESLYDSLLSARHF